MIGPFLFTVIQHYQIIIVINVFNNLTGTLTIVVLFCQQVFNFKILLHGPEESLKNTGMHLFFNINILN